MQMHENLLVIKYREILKYNGIAPEKIKILVKEYIDYIEERKLDNLSDELIQFLTFFNLNEQQNNQESNRKRI